MAAQNRWKIHQTDVKLAFLNGFLKVDVYILQPPDYVEKVHEDKILKLKRALHGLKHMSSAWNLKLDKFLQENGFMNSRLDKFLRENGFIKCPYEHGLYRKVNSNGDILIVCLYVDDLIL